MTDSGTRVVLTHRGLTESDGHRAGVLAGFAKHSLERNLTEDAVLIFPGPNNVYTKRQCIESMRDHPPYQKYDIDDTRIVHLAETTAVITHRAIVSNAKDASPRTILVSTVLIKAKGAWRMTCISGHRPTNRSDRDSRIGILRHSCARFGARQGFLPRGTRLACRTGR